MDSFVRDAITDRLPLNIHYNTVKGTNCADILLLKANQIILLHQVANLHFLILPFHFFFDIQTCKNK